MKDGESRTETDADREKDDRGRTCTTEDTSTLPPTHLAFATRKPHSNDPHVLDSSQRLREGYPSRNDVRGELPEVAAQGLPARDGSQPRCGAERAHALNKEATELVRKGRLDEAVELYKRAIDTRPDFAEAYNNLGIVHGRQGHIDESIQCFNEALRLKPEYPEAHNNLGIALARQRRFEDAVGRLEEALRLRPSYPEAQNNLGNTFRSMGRLDEAIASYRRALTLKPDYPEANNNLGNALAEQIQLEEAAVCYREAIRLNPRYAEAHNNLGNTLARLGQDDEAELCYQKALRYNADYAEAHNNLGNALAEKSRLAEAVACYHQALRIKSDYAEAYNNLGITLVKQGKHAEAERCYQDALRLKPDYADAHLNRALGWLQSGNFEQGWSEYEWRWSVRETTRPKLTGPAWNGEPLGGRTILLYSEQGLGDTLQFIRYAAQVKRRGGVVLLESQRQLIPLLSRCKGIDRFIPRGATPPEYHCHCALMSLPRVFRTRVANVPAAVPYLSADPGLVAAWRDRLCQSPGFRIGINWQGNPQYKGDRLRSISLKTFARLAEIPGVRLISLQKHHGVEQIREVADQFDVEELRAPYDDVAGAFMDAAAVIMNLDLVITSDTALAHLAGGLGATTWMPLSWSADWRWMEHRTDTPWYPTMRLFRQLDPGDWESVFERMATELRALVPTQRLGRSIPVTITAGELVDRLLGLELRSEDGKEQSDINRELHELRTTYERFIGSSTEIEGLAGEMKALLITLRETERQVRACVQEGDFGARFMALSRISLQQNERRDLLKRSIDNLA
ncbi:MAG: tetratricopeptide repeat-containing glycosyltransferase family protein [Isosphaeraceae bacterium]|nr:tetratricopeptide repeat-containing glycosyltransferase family protein [Isosphaeraceae bacterium]